MKKSKAKPKPPNKTRMKDRRPPEPAEKQRPWQAVLDFWFGTLTDDGRVDPEQSKKWWIKDPEFDTEIDANFRDLREQASQARLQHWENIPRGRLALILLVDQFSRNLFRDDARAYTHDALARRWCLEGLTAGHDRRLRPIERVFFYMPLQHSENLAEQERSLEVFEKLLEDVGESQREAFDGFVDFARRHHKVVAKYNRFPHRNEVLGRASTPEEKKFLKSKKAPF